MYLTLFEEHYAQMGFGVTPRMALEAAEPHQFHVLEKLIDDLG